MIRRIGLLVLAFLFGSLLYAGEPPKPLPLPPALWMLAFEPVNPVGINEVSVAAFDSVNTAIKVDASAGSAWQGAFPNNADQVFTDIWVPAQTAIKVNCVNGCAGSGGTVTSLTATSPIVITPSPTTTTGVISCPTCSTSNPLSGMTANFIPKAATATTITGNSALDDGSTVAATISTSEPINIASSPIEAGRLGNNGTATVLNKLASRTGAPSTWTLAAVSATNAAGVCNANCGNSGTPEIVELGPASCVFDGATTAGHYVGPSTGTAGDCTDLGATYPATGEVIGIVDSTNGSAGTYVVDFNPPDLTLPGAAGGGKLKGSGTNTDLVDWTGTSSLGDVTNIHVDNSNGGRLCFGAAIGAGTCNTTLAGIGIFGGTPNIQMFDTSGSHKHTILQLGGTIASAVWQSIVSDITSANVNNIGVIDNTVANSSGDRFVITEGGDIVSPLGNTSFNAGSASTAKSTSNFAAVLSGSAGAQPQVQLGNANNQTSLVINNGSSTAANTGLVVATGSGSHTGVAVTSASASQGEMDLAFLQTSGSGSWTAFKLLGPTSTWGWFVDDTSGIYQLQDVTNSQAVMACNEASAKDDCQIGKLGASPGAPPTGISLGDSSSNVLTVSHSGLVTHYGPTATTGNGVPAEYGTAANLTAQSAAITATTIYATTATGFYRVCFSADITTASDGSSTLGGANGFQIVYTSPTDSVAKTTVPHSGWSSAANTTATAVGGCDSVYAKTGTNIQYSFGYTDSHTTTGMAFEIHVSAVEAL